MITPTKTFGEVVSYLRTLKGVSKEEMAAEMMITVQKLNYIESTKELQDQETVEMIIKYFEIPRHLILFL